jgi:hypothetical protein
MSQAPIIVGGIPIPSHAPLFLAVLAVHVLAGAGSVVTGLVAMVSPKRPGRHPRFGTLYYRCLTVVFASTAFLSAMRWLEDYHLFLLGTLSFGAAFVARRAVRRRSGRWVRLHVTGMGLSYVLLLTAFYVDNGKNLPLWRDLPALSYWLLPAAVGVPIILRALWRHPLARAERQGTR